MSYPGLIDLPHDCYLPTAKRRRAGIVHVCGMCGQAWVCNTRRPTDTGPRPPDSRAWRWHRWPFEGQS